MYQFSESNAASGAADLFLISSSSTKATPDQRSFVTAMTSLLRTSITTDVTAALRDVLIRCDRRGYPTMDLVAAAEYAVQDEMFAGTMSVNDVHGAIHAVAAQIARATHTIPAIAA